MLCFESDFFLTPTCAHIIFYVLYLGINPVNPVKEVAQMQTTTNRTWFRYSLAGLLTMLAETVN